MKETENEKLWVGYQRIVVNALCDAVESDKWYNGSNRVVGSRSKPLDTPYPYPLTYIGTIVSLIINTKIIQFVAKSNGHFQWTLQNSVSYLNIQETNNMKVILHGLRER